MDRDFKGVWIPKEIWLNEDLNSTEKLLLVEIDSLAKNGECFASNEHFAKFLRIGVRQVQNALVTLKELGFISTFVIYKEGTKQVEKRIITPHVKNYMTPCNSLHDPHEKNCMTPHEKNFMDNNTVITNTITNTISKSKKINKKSAPKSELESEFETLWAIYPRKINRAKALISYIKARKDKKYTYETIKIGLERYIEQLEILGTEPEYIMHGSTFFNQERFNDEYNVIGLKKKPKGALDLYYREFGGMEEDESRRNTQVVDLYSQVLPEPFQERGF